VRVRVRVGVAGHLPRGEPPLELIGGPTVFARIADVYRRTRKPKDLLWNRFVARPLAAVVLVPLESTRITPNQVTLGTLLVFAAAVAVLVADTRWAALLLGVAL